jgi:predicted kinase
MECEYCKKIFSTKSSLNYHQSTAKYCLQIRKENMMKLGGELEKVHTEYTNKIKEHEGTVDVKAKVKGPKDKKTIVSKEKINDTEEIEEKYPPVNQVKKLVVANLTEKDFEGCRVTPEGKFAVYDAIAKFKGCNDKRARETYELSTINGTEFSGSVDLHQFPKSNGRKGQAIPVCTFSELLPILSQLPGEQAKILRREQAEICNLVLEGKEEEINTIIQARHPDRDVKLITTENKAVNPVDKLNIANLTEKDFEGCRVTPEGRFSVYDVIAKFKRCDIHRSKESYDTLCKNDVYGNFVNIDRYKFKGQGQKPTPVCTFSELLTILSQLPGEQAKILRREQAEICNLVLEGKEEEINTIIQARHPDKDVKLITTENKAVNPVDKLNIANVTEKDFEGCRITPEGKFAVYDVIAKFKGCDDRESRKIYDRVIKNSNLVGGYFPPQLNEHQFRRKNGALGPPIPVCTFSELLTILSQLPGEQAKILRREQAEITTRAIAGDRDLREFVEEREKTVPQETREILMTGLEQRPYTIEDFNRFYEQIKNDPKYMVSMDLSQNNNKDVLYIGIFRPTDEYLQENIDKINLRDRFFCKFGVSGEVISRSGNHLNDDNFIDYTVIGNFTYHNSFGRSSAEDRMKMILTNMNLRVNYYNKKEIFVCSNEELNIVFEHMRKHNEDMNDAFAKPFKDEVELEKIRLEHSKEIEICKIKLEKEKELEKMEKFVQLFRDGRITFEQLKEVAIHIIH